MFIVRAKRQRCVEVLICWEVKDLFSGCSLPDYHVVHARRRKQAAAVAERYLTELYGVGLPDNRERFSPVALSAEKPVAQFEVDCLPA
jgi:hypothetical protein